MKYLIGIYFKTKKLALEFAKLEKDYVILACEGGYLAVRDSVAEFKKSQLKKL